MNALKTIYNILSNDAEVSGIVSTRIYPSVVPQKISNPYIEFDAYNTQPTDTKDGGSKLDIYYVEISCYHVDALTCLTLANHVRGALDRFTGLNSDNIIDKIIFETQDGPYWEDEKELFRIDCDYRIRAKVDFGSPQGAYEMDFEVYVFGVLSESGSINPIENNTINIEP